MNVWTFIVNNIVDEVGVSLLFVINSQGSSPGRKGFVMAVNEQGVFEGTIGGGIMEVKMIELAKNKMKKGDLQPIVRDQYHDKLHKKNQSGLICSGSQIVTCIPLNRLHLGIVQSIVERKSSIFVSINSEVGLQISPSNTEEIKIKSSDNFQCVVELTPPKTIHIFGAGHVGEALARQMSLLKYRICLYDDRTNLPKLSELQSDYIVKIIDYGNLKMEFQPISTDIIVIASFSYRSDLLLLRQLYNLPISYIGMMGSDHKIETLKKELLTEGVSEGQLESIFAPIGLNMYSKTAAEIAVSIAGQIILEANKNLPSGRSY